MNKRQIMQFEKYIDFTEEQMNLIEATNYYLGEAKEPNKIMAMVAKVLKMFKIDTSLFTDPAKAKEFLTKNKESFAKANALYNKVVGVSESYMMSEGMFDMFRGLNKTVLAMFVFIAISATLNKAHASPADIAANLSSIASQVQVMDTDPTDTHAGYDVQQTGHDDVKKILHGLEPEDLEKLKDSVEKEGMGGDWENVKNLLKTMIAQSFSGDTNLDKRINGLDAHELEKLVDNALKQVS